MALKSMTGFGRGEAAARGVRVEVEISSVNRKQLDIQVCLPRGLAALESMIVKEFGRGFSRGCISVSVNISAPGRAAKGPCVDEKLASGYVSALRRTAKKLGLKDDLAAEVLTRLPDVLKHSTEERDAATVWPVVKTALGKAQAQLARMRSAEGAKLHRDIAQRLETLREQVDCIRPLSGTVSDKHRKALLARIEAAGVGAAADDPQVLKEVVFFADRSDISEEITRLGSHFGQAAKLLVSDKPVGRTLDFLTQEMFREITTIGSKAGDADISRHVVTFKTELERIREQAQNIE